MSEGTGIENSIVYWPLLTSLWGQEPFHIGLTRGFFSTRDFQGCISESLSELYGNTGGASSQACFGSVDGGPFS